MYIIGIGGMCYYVADVTTTQFWLQNANAKQMNGRHGNKHTHTRTNTRTPLQPPGIWAKIRQIK